VLLIIVHSECFSIHCVCFVPVDNGEANPSASEVAAANRKKKKLAKKQFAGDVTMQKVKRKKKKLAKTKLAKDATIQSVELTSDATIEKKKCKKKLAKKKPARDETIEVKKRKKKKRAKSI